MIFASNVKNQRANETKETPIHKLWKAIRRLWLFATCDHFNATTILDLGDSTELVFCRVCGRILYCTNEGERRHNLHLLFPALDYTKPERDRCIAEFEKQLEGEKP